jgi:hypothetical protein
MNPVNFIDPMGLWKIIGKWSSRGAYVKRQKKDTLEELAILITGNPEHAKLLTDGKKVDVLPLIELFEENVRNNIADVAVNWSTNFGGEFSNDINKIYGITKYMGDEALVNSWFDGIEKKYNLVDCYRAAYLFREKGLIKSLNPGEYNVIKDIGTIRPESLYITEKDNWIIKLPHINLNDLKKGTIIHFKNTEKYKKYVGNFGGMVGEYVIKVDKDSFIGFDYKNAKSYLEWKEILMDEYNLNVVKSLQININDVPGYYGSYEDLNYYEIIQKLFNERKKKKNRR